MSGRTWTSWRFIVVGVLMILSFSPILRADAKLSLILVSYQVPTKPLSLRIDTPFTSPR